MKRTAGLGRGLDVLLPSENDALSTAIRSIAVEDIDPNRNQPRRTFDESSLQELADSIAEHGILSPILVVENGSRYRIVAGERRYRAARLAGLDKLPCIVKDMTGEEQMTAAIIENVQRQDLNPMEEALALESLMQEHAFTQEELAKKLGKSRPAIANALRLCKLPQEIADMVAAGDLSAGHARVLCGIEDKSRQLGLAKRCLQGQWSVRQLEEAAKDQPAAPTKVKPAGTITPEMQSLSDSFRNVFGLKLQWKGNDRKGQISFRYNSPEELDQLFEKLKLLEAGE